LRQGVQLVELDSAKPSPGLQKHGIFSIGNGYGMLSFALKSLEIVKRRKKIYFQKAFQNK